MYGKVLGLFLFISSAIFAQNNTYTLKGSIENDQYNGKKVYLQQLNKTRDGFVNIDSTTVKGNRFVFTKTTQGSEPALRFISTEEPVTYAPAFFLTEPGEINLTIGQTNKVEGTPRNNRFQEFTNLQDSLNNKIETVVQHYSQLLQTSGNEEKMLKEGQAIMKELQKSRYNFAKENINNDLGEFIALSSFEVLTPDQVLELTALMRPEFRNSDLGQQVITYYQQALAVREAKSLQATGAPYKDITLKDPLGNNISLSDYVGKHKVVLIDFWASWCGPCIKEMPHVIEAYNQYKDKGFEIVGISMDEDQSRWLGAIDRLNMTWPQMSDLKGWKSAAAKLYGINSIPFTLLIDKDGKIIDSNLRGTQLLTKLQELLN